ncbi:imidazole glycerol phosphate synthase subunit HisF [Clostridia bacterium]|nr:imidazole glycerol phosphate synthase subunit HisF [Clostridia bacterium]
MLTKRIIPCLDVRDGRVVKGTNFTGLKDVSDPVELAAFYNGEGADELVFYDITASFEGRALFCDILSRVAEKIFIPLTVGGAINTTDDFGRVLAAGADKVSVNSGAVREPKLIEDAAKKYGSQCVVLSMDVKRVDGAFRVFSKGGRELTDLDAIEWVKRGEALGAGEIVVNSMDADGVKNGFDLEMLGAILPVVSVPVIASGGAGGVAHFAELFKTLPEVGAGLAASIFHYREVSIAQLKQELRKNGIEVRI